MARRSSRTGGSETELDLGRRPVDEALDILEDAMLDSGAPGREAAAAPPAARAHDTARQTIASGVGDGSGALLGIKGGLWAEDLPDEVRSALLGRTGPVRLTITPTGTPDEYEWELRTEIVEYDHDQETFVPVSTPPDSGAFVD